MGHAQSTGTCSCTCNDSRSDEEDRFSTQDRGVYPHFPLATNTDEMQPALHVAICSEPPAIKNAQDAVKNFVRALVKGYQVELLSVRGGTVKCMAHIDRGLTMLSLERGMPADARRRDIPLQEVQEVLVGEQGGEAFNLQTDDLCVTVVLESQQALAFAFLSEEERDTFALCLAMFVDDLHKKNTEADDMQVAVSKLMVDEQVL
mmetsp:Transcript_126563/g.253022  ORF Transcript_126563/g.253022 Transcript_126563/m.253022 type:complete len:204 (-) Transcript_126563:122-733(-)